MAIINVELDQALTFFDSPDSMRPSGEVDDVLTFTELISSSLKGVYLNDILIINQHYKVDSVIRNLTVHQAINFQDHAYRSHYTAISDYLSLAETYHAYTHYLIQQINWTESFIGLASKTVNDDLVFSETIGLNHYRHLTVADTLTFEQDIVVYKSSFNISNQPVDQIIIVENQNNVKEKTLELSGIGDILLRAPDYDNVDEINLIRIQRETRGGDLSIFADSNWPEIETFSLRFSYLNEAQKAALIGFVKNNIGLPVTLRDHNNRSYTGLILTPTDEVMQPGRFNYTAQLQFQLI